MKIHIEGMGIIGSLLALRLTASGQDFTWNDTEETVCAWKASTGCIYPSGDAFDTMNYDAWWLGYFGQLPELEQATYCFLSKHPPHKGKYQQTRVGVFGVAEVPSLHLNAQKLVCRVRGRFKGQRCSQVPPGAQIVVTHGFGVRLDHYLWGWAAKVRLKIPSLPGERQALYMRVGRFKLAYAYPVPCELGWHYAGSSLIMQRVAKGLDIVSKFKKWCLHVRGYTNVRILETGEMLQGWRPVAAKGDDKLIREIDGRWVLKPLWSSGIRHAPAIVRAVLERL